MKQGQFYIIGTPIGNFEDISYRAIKVLKTLDYIMCEDTRETKYILSHFNIDAKCIAYNSKTQESIDFAENKLKEGKSIGFVSDRGMPTISDPGSRLISELKNREIKYITCIPGPSSITTAFALSGYSGNFIFQGFLPRKESQILKLAEQLNSLEDYNIIFFESPIRLQKTLKILSTVFSERKLTLCKDLTKTFEKVCEKSWEAAIKDDYKGEHVIIIKKKD